MLSVNVSLSSDCGCLVGVPCYLSESRGVSGTHFMGIPKTLSSEDPASAVGILNLRTASKVKIMRFEKQHFKI